MRTAGTDTEEGGRKGSGEISKIFPAHAGRQANDIFPAGDGGGAGFQKSAESGVAHKDGITLAVNKTVAGTVGRGGPGYQALDFFRQGRTHRFRQRPHRAPQFDLVGDDIVGRSAPDGADGDHNRLQWADLAADDGLQGGYHLGGDDDGVDGLLGMGAVPAPATHEDSDFISGGAGLAVADADLTEAQAVGEVKTEHGLDRRFPQHALFDHRPGASRAFFGRLKDELDRPWQGGQPSQYHRRPERYGDMAVVAAGVGYACIGRSVGDAGFLLDGQGVHIGADSKCPPAAAGQKASDAGAGDADLRFKTAVRQLAYYKGGRFLFPEGQFGLAVYLPPERYEFWQQLIHYGLPVHDNTSLRGVKRISKYMRQAGKKRRRDKKE